MVETIKARRHDMTDQDKKNIDTVRLAYTDDGKKAISPNIVWHVPGTNPVAGVYKGAKAYHDDMVQRMQPITEWVVEVGDVMINGELAVASIRIRGLRKGHRIDME